MSDSSFQKSKTAKFFDVLRFICYGIICAILGFMAVWWIFRIIDGSPDGVCNSLKHGFKHNDTFEYSSCRLIHNDELQSDEIRLVLKIRKGMEVYFDDEPKVISEKEISSSQIEYYCSEFFSKVRVDYLDLSIKFQGDLRQQMKISRNICE